MTVAEMVDFVESITGENVNAGRLLALFNVAQDEISKEARIPRGTATFSDVTQQAELALPSDGRQEGVEAIYALSKDSAGDVTGSTPLPLYTTQEAEAIRPSWTFASAGAIATMVVYDPAQEFSTLYPVPPPDSSNPHHYRLVYQIKPDHLVNMTDQPFNGGHESFHKAVAYRALFWLTGDNRWQGEYDRLVESMQGQSRYGGMPKLNATFSRTVGARGGRR